MALKSILDHCHQHCCHQHPSLPSNTTHCCQQLLATTATTHYYHPHPPLLLPTIVGGSGGHLWLMAVLVGGTLWLQWVAMVKKLYKNFVANELKCPKKNKISVYSFFHIRGVVQTWIWTNPYVFLPKSQICTFFVKSPCKG